MNPPPHALVTTAWLAERLADPAVRILDGSWYLPQENRDAKAEFAAARIPGARFFDIDAVADKSTTLPHMLPAPESFAAAVTALGIANSHTVVCYDGHGLFSAARVWWEFRTFGHDQVVVLDGGFRKWRAENRPVETAPFAAPRPAAPPFVATLDRRWVRSIEDVRANLASRREQFVDARAAARFSAEVPEPRPGIRAGHVPGSYNLPYAQLVDPATGTLIAPAAIERAFKAAGVDLTRPIVTSCGSGIVATVLTLGLHLLGHRDNAVYDGSWTEWGGRADTPIDR
jgi:thiosulfate/3-mercaptopyruvate sulfurtransferase